MYNFTFMIARCVYSESERALTHSTSARASLLLLLRLLLVVLINNEQLSHGMLSAVGLLLCVCGVRWWLYKYMFMNDIYNFHHCTHSAKLHTWIFIFVLGRHCVLCFAAMPLNVVCGGYYFIFFRLFCFVCLGTLSLYAALLFFSFSFGRRYVCIC